MCILWRSGAASAADATRDHEMHFSGTFVRSACSGDWARRTSAQGTPALAQLNETDVTETEQLMKLTSEQVKQTVNQLGAQVLPDEHPAMPQLNSMFGEHTFFVDETGLKVVEPTAPPGTERQSGEVVSLADWGDSELTRLMAHEPEPTGVIVVFEHVRH
jgi:hypothetical protein